MKKTYTRPTANTLATITTAHLLAASTPGGSPDITYKGEGGSDMNTAKANPFDEWEEEEVEEPVWLFTQRSVWD